MVRYRCGGGSYLLKNDNKIVPWLRRLVISWSILILEMLRTVFKVGLFAVLFAALPEIAAACDASGNPEAKVVRLGILSWSSLGGGALIGALYALRVKNAQKEDQALRGAMNKSSPMLVLALIFITTGFAGLWLKNLWCY